MFSIIDGVARVFPGLPRAVSWLGDGNRLHVFLPAGLGQEDRADRLAAAMWRHTSARLAPQEVMALLHRAFRTEVPVRVESVAASVARWIPAGVR